LNPNGRQGALNGNIQVAGSVTFNQLNAVTLNNTITGIGSVIQSGPETLTLLGNNTYSGGTSISSGTLAVGHDSALGIGTLTMAPGTTLQAAASVSLSNPFMMLVDSSNTVDTNGNALTLRGNVTGSGGLTKIGTGTLTLIPDQARTVNFTGTITINAGTLDLDGGDPTLYAPLGEVDVNNSSTFEAGTAVTISTLQSASTSSKVVLQDTLTIANGSTTFAGAISGGYPFPGHVGLKVTGGIQTLSGTNTYSGGTSIDGGTLALTGSGSVSGLVAVGLNATFDISGTTSGTTIQTLAGVSGTVKLGSKTLTIANGATTFGGTLQGTGGLTVSGGTEVLSGTNTYSGKTTVERGTLELAAGASAGTGTIAFGGPAATLQIDGTTMPSNTIDAFARGDVIDLRGLVFVAGATANYDSGTHVLTVTSNSASQTLMLTNPAKIAFGTRTNDGFGGTQVSLAPPPTLTTAASPDVSLSKPSVTLGDSATLSGGFSPTGSIVFTLTGPGGFLYTQTDAVSGNGTYTAAATLPTIGTVAGTYSWTAHYTGDGNNEVADASADTLILFSSPYPLPPPATSADIADGLYAIYAIGNNMTLDAHPLAQVGSDWQFAGLGSVQAGGGTAMLLRQQNGQGATGSFEIYNIINNNIVSAAPLGQLDGQVQGFGNFGSRGANDVLLRNGAAFSVADIANDQIIGMVPLGIVGLNWQLGGFGNFSGNAGEYDMLLRDMNSGGLQVYDISNDRITNSAFMGTVGLDWQISGFGGFGSRPGETDMIMRNANTGGLQVYDIANNQITGTAFLGTVGLDWQFAGVAPVRGADTSDLILRNVNTGEFEAYNIANNQIIGAASLGQVGLDWQLSGLADDPAAASMGSSDSSTAQLVQAMAGFGGGHGAADGLNAAGFGAEPSQQQFLTAPQHA
jgi:autotransporter-associated beta strand protein